MTLQPHSDRSPKTGIVVGIHGNKVDVQAAGSNKFMRGLGVVGGVDSIEVGERVLLTLVEGKMYAHSTSAPSGQGRSVGGNVIGSGSSAMIPHSMSYHTDEASWHSGLTGADLHDPADHALSYHSDVPALGTEGQALFVTDASDHEYRDPVVESAGEPASPVPGMFWIDTT